jgi:hypothetical protein
MDLSKYIKIIPTKDDEPELVEQVKEAMQWFASTPEGSQAMEDAVKKHGRPLPILVGSNVYQNCFGDFGDGMVMALNPPQAQASQIITNEGNLSPYGLRPTIAHEYEHARQDLTIEQMTKFAERQYAIK